MAKSRAFMPEAPNELTAAWLSDVLGADVADVEITDLGDGVGFMGDVLKLGLTIEGATDTAVVAKLPKKANRVMGELLGVYEREIMFFREFSDTISLRIPRMLYSDFDRDRGSENQREILQKIDKLPGFLSRGVSALGTVIAGAKKRRYVLLIEYLQDMTVGDQLAGLDASVCAQVLNAIAPMHRQYSGQLNLDEHFWLLPLDVDARLRQGIFKQNVKPFILKLQGLGLGHLEEHVEWLQSNGEELTRRLMQDAPTTLLHGDLRLDNVAFKDAGCGFIDWQLVRCGPAAYDVAYFLSSALHADADPDVVSALLADYHCALASSDYPLTQFERDYQRALMVIFANLAGVDTVDLGDGRGQPLMQAWFKRLGARLAAVDIAAL